VFACSRFGFCRLLLPMVKTEPIALTASGVALKGSARGDEAFARFRLMNIFLAGYQYLRMPFAPSVLYLTVIKTTLFFWRTSSAKNILP
jgi:hypothetical protein